MAKKYLTPDFDVTAYDIKDILTIDIGGGMDGDDEFDAGASLPGDGIEWD